MAFLAPHAVVFLAGVAAFLSPCIIPMVTVYLSLITGMSVEDLRAGEKLELARGLLFQRTLFFVLGFIVVFIIAGGMAGLVGGLMRQFQRPLELAGGVVILLLGLRMLGLLRLAMSGSVSSKLRRPKVVTSPAGAFGVGLFYAVACSHCLGPLLYSTLIYAGLRGSAGLGMSTMFAFSIGLGLSYLVLSLLLGSLLDYLGRLKDNLWVVSAASGVIMVAVGIIILSGNFTVMSTWVGKVVPFRLPGGM